MLMAIPKYKEEDFNMQKYDQIHASGTWMENEKCYNINTSSILTKLIQEAGRLCDNYASDLFIDWSSLQENLKDKNYMGGRLLFGFRENGVDHNAFIFANINENKERCRYYYRAIYALDIVIIPGTYQKIEMTLGKCFYV